MGQLSLLRRYSLITAAFTALSIIYVLFSLLPKPDARTLAHYKLNSGQLKGLLLTILIPYLIIWALALVGYIRLRFYSDSISKSKDGKAFAKVSQGLMALSLWLPASATIGAVFTYIYSRHPAATASLVIIDNYINVIILVVAFSLLDQGAKKFASVTRSVKNAPNQTLIFVFVAFATFYTWLSLADPVRYHPGHNVLQATYYEPDWLIVLTIIIPRLFMWFLGMQAVQNIYYYRTKVKGIIYKSSLFSLSLGIGGVVIATIVLRSVQSLASEIEKLSLTLILLIIYILLIIIGIGYYLINKGAKNLQQIESS